MTEQELIQGSMRGSAQCQRQLYNLHAGKMYAVCLRYARTPSDAADILQEGFVRVFSKLTQFNFQGSFEGWIRRIMVNTALRTYQRSRYNAEHTGMENMPEATVEPDVMAALSETDLLRLIARLPEGYRLVFNLVAIEGYTHLEAAALLGIQESTSRSQLAKARRLLMDQVEALYAR